MDYTNDPQRWPDRAEEARVRPDQTTNEEARRMLLAVADGYDLIAEKAEATLGMSAQTPPRSGLSYLKITSPRGPISHFLDLNGSSSV